MHSDLKLEIDVVIQLISDSDQMSEGTRAWILGVMRKVKDERDEHGRDANQQFSVGCGVKSDS